ncbi:hypothetical protein AKJ40_03865 [candidate division MSBL1 archaeon SCGC-AAA259M10]|uniref:Uncharacterized protein n=1 Tax=candidate division MSBL1 archaeon SCGC-AAA259M10 TaxID=1698270 RepID=A0A133UY89_9EURY|nr:hypothetical protein AKJ40_03865 [candidate division MSBL1 archaeon SCGC-AAA259M10]
MLKKTTRHHQQIALFAKRTQREKEEARLARELLREKLEEHIKKQGAERIVGPLTSSDSLRIYYCPKEDRILEIRYPKSKGHGKGSLERYKLLHISTDTRFERTSMLEEDLLSLQHAISLNHMQFDSEIEEKVERMAKHFNSDTSFSLEGTSKSELKSLYNEIQKKVGSSSINAAHLYRVYSETPDVFWEEVPLSHWLEGSGRWKFEEKHSSRTLPGPELFQKVREEKPTELTAVRLGGSPGDRNGKG